MNHEDIKKKDWQLLTAYSELTTLSYLITIHENQAFIIAKLTNRDQKDVLDEMNKQRLENYESTKRQALENIPDYTHP